MNILLCGLLISNGNLGCVALTYSALTIFEQISKASGINFYYAIIAGRIDDNAIDKMCEKLKIEKGKVSGIEIHDVVRNSKDRRKYIQLLNDWADVVFDATQGDSFADIYGWRRMLTYSAAKLIAEHKKVPLILAPQTYGPYKQLKSRLLARRIVNKAALVMSRDQLSKDVLLKMGIKQEITVVSDMAFFLPFDVAMKEEIGTIKVGINVSGLLWNGGYTQNNQFGLAIDYKRTIDSLIAVLSVEKKYEVFLIPHVISEKANSVEDDYKICREIAVRYQVNCAPRFSTPVEAKNYISKMDVFIGSRMHATIAAFSAGVATIPLAYSRKFAGLYENLGYHYVINLCEETDKEIVMKITSNIDEYEKLKDAVMAVQEKVKKSQSELILILRKYLEGILNNEKRGLL